jgi:MFS transporter, VNT family, synaptic vesicle glycoprotein 2
MIGAKRDSKQTLTKLTQSSSFIASILYASFNFLLPGFALIIINQEWSIDIFGLVFKPWRLFLLICGVPNLICALTLIFVIPESPKFTYSQGDEQKTLEIFRKIHRMNNGKPADSFEVSSIIKNEEFGEGSKESSQGFFNFMWSQTTPLFKGSHLRNILTACFIQFAVCNTTNGFWTFLPEIMNKLSLWDKDSKGSATLCEIFNAETRFSNETLSTIHCVDKLEISTYLHVFEIAFAYTFCYTIMSLVINWTGKLILITTVVFATGVSAFSLIFVNLPTVSLYLYLTMILAGLAISVVNASTVELFPTNMRFGIAD